MRDDDFWFKCIVFVLCAVLVGFGGWGFAYGCHSAYQYVLFPTFRFLQMYFAQYGRITAELGGAAFLIMAGLTFHFRTMNSVTGRLVAFCKEIEATRNELQSKLSAETARNMQLLKDRTKVESELWALRDKNKTLQGEIDDLWKEFEKVVEPEKAAEREQKEEKEEATDELFDHVEQTHWRTA